MACNDIKQRRHHVIWSFLRIFRSVDASLGIIMTALGAIALVAGQKVLSRSNELTDEQSDDDED